MKPPSLTSPFSQWVRTLLARCDFAILALFVLVANLVYLKSTYVPRHDTMHVFNLFYFFYNELFFRGEIAQWMPYCFYGLPSSHDQLFGLTPVSYGAMLAGWLLRIKDVLFLFKVSLICEQLVFLLGIYLLSRLLFSRRSTAFMVCLGTLLGFNWSFQLFFDFHIYYMFPLASFFFVLFFIQRRPEFLWLTGITVLAWVMGCPLYFISLWFLVFFLMGVVLLIYDRDIWRCLFARRRWNILLFLTFIGLCFSFYYPLRDIINFAYIADRGPGGKNSLGFFLTYGVPTKIQPYLEFFIFGEQVEGYIGLILLVFFLWALIKVRGKTFFAFLVPTIALIWISVGGVFSTLCYFFPGMVYYRHIGYVYALIKILIAICAGFGLDHFWSAPVKTKISLLSVIVAVLIFVVDSLGISSHGLSALSLSDTPLKDLLLKINWTSAYCRIGVYLVAISLMVGLGIWAYISKKIKRLIISEMALDRSVKIILLLSFLIDTVSFECHLYKGIPVLSSEYQPALASVQVHPRKFQPQRLEKPQDLRQKQAYELVTRPGVVILYTVACEFLQFDPCRPQFKVHLVPMAIRRLLDSREDNDPDLFQVLGCGRSKLRLISRAIFADNDQQAVEMIKAAPQLYDTVILSGVDEKDKEKAPVPAAGSLSTARLSEGIIVRKFTTDEIEAQVDVPSEDGAWLVYADTYHPGWQAAVDGQKVHIYKAYLALKALRLEKGRHVVRFVFRNGLSSVISYFIFLFGILITLILSAVFFGMLLAGTGSKWISRSLRVRRD